MKILIDMNLSPRWQKFLTEAGLQAAHWSELGAGDASDLDIMAYAEAHDYVVLTHDLDFAATVTYHGCPGSSCPSAVCTRRSLGEIPSVPEKVPFVRGSIRPASRSLWKPGRRVGGVYHDW
jgi:hypothetical protein